MGRNAFLDPVISVLKCHGFVETNAPGDVKISVPDDFALAPGKWQWNGTQWIPFTPPPPPPDLRPSISTITAALQSAATLADLKAALLQLIQRVS